MENDGKFVDEPMPYQVYKCPFCDYIHVSKDIVTKHMKGCKNNSNYTQDCSTCKYLDRDYKYNMVAGKQGICFHTGRFGHGCIYKNHDASTVDAEIEKVRADHLRHLNYDSRKSPEENWKREEEYMRRIASGENVDVALKAVYGEHARTIRIRKKYL